MLSIDGVSVDLGGLRILEDVSFKVAKQSITALVGPNGAGKTTVLNAILGVNPTRSGHVSFDGKDVSTDSTKTRVRNGMALVPEGRRIFPDMTVKENLLLGGFVRRRQERVAQLESVLRLFPWITERMNQLGGTLSGGEQQMVAIARALMSNPALLMLDEVSLGIAPKIVDQIFATLTGYVRKSGLTLLVVEQNVKKVLEISDYVYIIERGRIVLGGPPKEMYNENLLKAYMGLGKA